MTERFGVAGVWQGANSAAQHVKGSERMTLPSAIGIAGDPDMTSVLTQTLCRHHDLVHSALPFLGPLVAKVARVHGDHDPRLVEVHRVFRGLQELLDEHLQREDEVLLRLIGSPSADPSHLKAEIDSARREHDELGAVFRRIRALCNEYSAPDWACTSYRRMLSELRAVEDELVGQIQLEDGTLFPRLVSAPLIDLARTKGFEGHPAPESGD